MCLKALDDFVKVTEDAEKVNKLMDEISAASQEQAQGIAQINRAVNEMDKVVQQNAAAAEESSSVSEEIRSQAGQLEESLRVFYAHLGLKNGKSIQTPAVKKKGTTRLHPRSGLKALPGSGKTNGTAKRRGQNGVAVSKVRPLPQFVYDEDYMTF
jgi:methyl-accepting chemotaxis protein